METRSGQTDTGFDGARRVDTFLAGLAAARRVAGWSWALLAHGRVVHCATGGFRDAERSLAVEPSTLFRIYSMTKPVTAVAAMLLRERGLLSLDDPVHVYLPEFAGSQVYLSGEGSRMRTRPARSPITVGQALVHTSGLTYGFHRDHPVDALYRSAGHDLEAPPGTTLEAACRLWASLPLLFDPGTSWNYSAGLDVVGRVIEVRSGLRLGQFFEREIFEPLGMTDSAFYVSEGKRDDLARIYESHPAEGLVGNETLGVNVFDPAAGHFGGGGLVSTLGDYARFARMLLGTGETAAGERLLHPASVELLLANHLPGNVDIASFGRPMASELGFVGLGQACGGTVRITESSAGDDATPPVPRSVGEYGWGGIAGTYFWVNPRRRSGAVFMLQAFPPASLTIRGELHRLVDAALCDGGV